MRRYSLWKKTGVFGSLIGVVLGLALGLSVFWRTRVTLKWVIQHLNLREPNLPPLCPALSCFICLAVFVGMVAVGILTSWLRRLVIQSIRWWRVDLCLGNDVNEFSRVEAIVERAIYCPVATWLYSATAGDELWCRQSACYIQWPGSEPRSGWEHDLRPADE